MREDQQPTGMVKQAEKAQITANGASGNGVAEAVDVDVLIRAPVLVLNLNYVPVNVCTVRRAIVLVTKAKLSFWSTTWVNSTLSPGRSKPPQ